MRFTYQYKTSDGAQHEGVYCASSRSAVYDELKKKGIKPFGVELMPGVWNRCQSFGKRVWIIIFLSVALLMALGAALYFHDISVAQVDSSSPRHQIYGDPALMAQLERDGYASVFPCLGDRILARYAQPGTVVVPENDLDTSIFAASLQSEIVVSAGDPREVVELKQIVRWMKNELREYLSDGVGTTATYYKRLNARQRAEVELYERIRRQMKGTQDAVEKQRLNEALRGVGLRTVADE